MLISKLTELQGCSPALVALADAVEMSNTDVKAKDTRTRVANAFRAMKAFGISEDKVKPALKNLLQLYDKNWVLIEVDNYRALADAVEMSNKDVKAKDSRTRIANAFRAMRAIGISEDEVKPALKNLLKLYDKNWALIEVDNYRALADAVGMSNKDVKAKDSRTRIANAFRAMRAIGISEDKVKPVLKNLLKLYDKNWALIEVDNYRALADAVGMSNKDVKAKDSRTRIANAFRAMRAIGISEDKVKPSLKNLLKLYDKNWALIEVDNYRALADAVEMSNEDVEAKDSRTRIANAFRAMRANGISEDKVKPALKNLLKLYDKNWALIEVDNYRALADAVEMSNKDVKAKDSRTRIANAFCAMRAIGISEDKVKPALKNLLKLYDKNWALIEEDNYRALADAVEMSNKDVKAKDSRTRIANAFRAMRAIGISEDKVKPALKNLLKLYDKNWALIEEDNYRALADAVEMSNKDVKAKDTRTRIASAFRAMRAIGISEDKVKPALKNLLKLYDKNWAPIEEDNYKALADAVEMSNKDVKAKDTRTRIANAFRAMKAIGISEDKVKPALKNLLKLYDKNWAPIEVDNYRALVDAVEMSNKDVKAKDTRTRIANAFRAMSAIGISEDKVKPALKNLLKLYDKNWALIEVDNYRALADAVEMSNKDVKAKDTRMRIANAFRAMSAIGISEDKVKPALKNLLKLYDKNWALIEEDNYRALADAVEMSNKDVKAKDTRERVANAFRAMRAIGISEDKVKPALKNLLKFYDKNLALIENDNYRALADAICESEKAEASVEQRSKKIVNSEAAGHSKKIVISEKESHLEEEAQATEEPERPLKRLRLRYRDGQTSSSNPSCSRVFKTPLAKPNKEPNELPESSPPKLNAPLAIVESPQPNVENTRVVKSQSLGKNKGKQPISPKPAHEENNTPLVNESRSPSYPMRLTDRGKESLSPQIPSLEKMSAPKSSSHALCLKEPPKQQDTANHDLIKSNDEPITDGIPCLEAPIEAINPDPSIKGDSSSRNGTFTEHLQPSVSPSVIEGETADATAAPKEPRNNGELAMISGESSSNLEIASSPFSKVKSLSYDLPRGSPDFHMPSLETLLKSVSKLLD
ncbi:hypothetical protein BUALT_Bualt13G0025200 [Buddleja alternifolia]|uniref:WIYLD domain-containing protein n=1 Tax=Buddleja alternifolia TaxID=168488 RepID=A0AAV6WV04_9LAMI|nr:hypothetical protein BUALT_Bualt13G0025200 [Buddleja alternifolia]